MPNPTSEAKPLRTDQKFAGYILPLISDLRSGEEGALCRIFHQLKLQWSVDQIRVVAKLAQAHRFNSIDHVHGWFVNALRNLEKGKALDDEWTVVVRKQVGPPDGIGFRELVDVWYLVNRKGVHRGPYQSIKDALTARDLA